MIGYRSATAAGALPDALHLHASHGRDHATSLLARSTALTGTLTALHPPIATAGAGLLDRHVRSWLAHATVVSQVGTAFTVADRPRAGAGHGGRSAVARWTRAGLRPAAAHVAAEAQRRFRLRFVGGREGRNIAGTTHRSDHATGRAVDLGVVPRSAQGDAVAAWAIRQPNVKYVIWNRRIWHPGRGWRRYVHPGVRSGRLRSTPTLRHEDHVHVSVY